MVIEVIVTPGARKERVAKNKAGKYEVAVREEAERNEANKRVRKIIADALKVPITHVRMVRGARSRKKIFNINA